MGRSESGHELLSFFSCCGGDERAGPLRPTNRPGITAYGAAHTDLSEVRGYVLWRATPLHVIGYPRHPDYPVAIGHVSLNWPIVW